MRNTGAGRATGASYQGVGANFTLLDKTSPGAISGTFAGKTEGSTFAAGGQNWQITYTRNKAAADSGYVFNIQSSDTLVASEWTNHGPGTVALDGPQQTVSATIPEGSAGRRFVRLQITAP
jgi:hypothetical protein